ncbi:GerAB/ArcD/ProY family transporter [Metabacillus dongyingensis]|uniref:GerAB/ArcD/ProY family transporter n=1 Tax=Metabacillus dongyingensis TaxID=2874282 RepID=UPI003B8E5CBA
MNMKSKISKTQLYFLMIQSQIGVGVLSLPSVTQKTAKGDAWITTIIAGIFIEMILVVYWLLLKRFPNLILTEFTKKIAGKGLGKILNFSFYMYFVLTACFAVIFIVNLINTWLLPLTPPWIISMLIMLASVYLAIDDIKIIARFFTLASFLILIIIILSILNFTQELDFQYVRPIGHSGFTNIFLGSSESIISMLGFEILLMSYPYVQGKEKGFLKTISLGNLSITFLYTFFVFTNLISFSPVIIKQIKEPLLYIFRGLSYQLIDRLDLIFISIWIVPMTTSVVAYLFMASKSISKKKSYSKLVVANGILIFCITLIPVDDLLLNKLSELIKYLSYIFAFGLPLFLLLVSYIFKKQEVDDV